MGRGLQSEGAVVVFACSCGSVCNKQPLHTHIFIVIRCIIKKPSLPLSPAAADGARPPRAHRAPRSQCDGHRRLVGLEVVNTRRTQKTDLLKDFTLRHEFSSRCPRRVLSINKPIIGAQWSVTWHAAQTFTDLGCAPHKKKEFGRASQSAVYFSLDRGSSSVG